MAKSNNRRFLLTLASASAVLATWAVPAAADRVVIKNPGLHPDYSVELEPHALVGLFGVPGSGSNEGFGLGGRVTIELVDNGFIQTINNTVGIGFGLDWVHFDDDRFCEPRRGLDCDDDDLNTLWIPIVMQWNFFLSENWSVFGEPGFALRYLSWDSGYCNGDCDEFDFDPFIFYAGGRLHFNDNISLTMRIGWPTFSVGASFFF